MKDKAFSIWHLLIGVAVLWGTILTIWFVGNVIYTWMESEVVETIGIEEDLDD